MAKMASGTMALGAEPKGGSTNVSPISCSARLDNGLFSVNEIAGCTTTVYPEFQQKTTFSVPNDVLLLSAEAVQDWVWDNYKDELRRAIRFVVVGFEDEKSKDDDDFVAEIMPQPRTEVHCSQPPHIEQHQQQMVPMDSLIRLSHEIRSPMVCMVGLAKMLKDTTELDDYQFDSVKLMLNTGTDLLDLVDGVLQYAKLENDVAVDVKMTNLQETLDLVVASCAGKADEWNVLIETLYDASVPEFVSTDGHLLQQILTNLIGNAIKFTHDGTAVQLRVLAGTTRAMDEACRGDETDEEGAPLEKAYTDLTSTFGANESPQFLRFAVKDFGKGIDEGNFAKIFEPFQQANTAETDDFEGMGLGLATSSRLVNFLGGEIRVKSQVDEWTEFFVDLPLHGTPADVKGLSQKLKNATILIVSDDSRDDIAITALARSGVDVVKVDTCQEVDVLVASKTAIDSRRVYMCLIQEDLYQPRTFRVLASAASSALLTFGPHRLVSETKCHFLSVARTLPSVVLEALVACLGVTPARRTPLVRRASEVVRSLNFDFSTVKALIAEDNSINQKVLLRMLKRLGMKDINVVDDGLQAVECLSQNRYDMVFLDNQMPVMDGLEACRAIKNQVVTDGPGPEIVFVTADVSDEFMLEAYKAGGNGFIAKPFDIRAIESYFRTQTKMYRPKSPMASLSMI